MSKLFKYGVLGALIVNSVVLNRIDQGNRYVSVVETSLPKTVDIIVPSILVQWTITNAPGGNFVIKQDTVTVPIEGAGAFISPNGQILTCAHLFQFPLAGPIQITEKNGKKSNATLLYKDPDHDLALLDTGKKSPYFKLTTSVLKEGQEVLAVGSPLGFPFSVSHGVISYVMRKEPWEDDIKTQSDTFINPGNSGGPLINLKGELVGINVSMVPPVNAPIFTGLGFSMTPQTIKRFLDRFKGL